MPWIAFKTRKLSQGDLLERLVDGVVDALPVAAHGAAGLKVAADRQRVVAPALLQRNGGPDRCSLSEIDGLHHTEEPASN